MSLSLCVFCGSSPGNHPLYLEVASQTGRAIAKRGWQLVYGAGSTGMMGAVAQAALDAGGKVIGIIPQFLTDWEPPLEGLTQVIVVETMAERKTVMMAHSDAYLSLPGGIGTMDELFEVWTLEALEVHAGPSAVLNVNGYFQPLLALSDHMVAEGYLRPAWREQLISGTELELLLDEIEQKATS
jgi:uncharacterized protein (TIGR00730 family)